MAKTKRVIRDHKGLYKGARNNKALDQQVLLAGGADCYLSQKKEISERRRAAKQRRGRSYDED